MSQTRKERAATGDIGQSRRRQGSVRADLNSYPSSGTPRQGHFEGAWREEGAGEGKKESDSPGEFEGHYRYWMVV